MIQSRVVKRGKFDLDLISVVNNFFFSLIEMFETWKLSQPRVHLVRRARSPPSKL